MAPFSIPAPSVVPLRTPLFGGPRTKYAIDTQTKIELMCDTYLAHEIYYTLDGTKPQPYAGIIQGSKLYKYKSPFCLPPGKITLKAMALCSRIRSMQSSVVTKYFEVIKTESDSETKRYFKKSEKRNASKVSKKKETNTDPVPFTESNGCKENINILDQTIDNWCRESGPDGLNDFPPDLEIFPEDDVSESLSEIPSFASGSNKTEELEGDHFEIQKTSLITPSPPLTESELPSQEKDGSFGANGFEKQYDVEEEDDLLKIDKKLPTSAVSSEIPTYCMKCAMILQFCRSCSSLNAVTSQYCMHCGEKLMQRCCNCKELNSVTGIYCHCCGKKLGMDDNELQVSYTDHCVMVEPQMMHASVQQIPSTVSKETQTLCLPKEKSRSTDAKRTPSHSPGRGYWHQQVDYICNHLKSYAYNNLEFRNSISEPILNDFQSAQITKTDDIVSVTISFSPFVKEKESKDLN